MNSKTTFNIISDADRIPFDYQKAKNGSFITEASDLLVDMAVDDETIEVIKRGIPNIFEKFSGRDEPIRIAGDLRILKPSPAGDFIDQVDIGAFKCLRCDQISTVEQKNGVLTQPFECSNETCGRKGPFVPQFPIELIKPIWKLPYGAVQCSAFGLYQEIHTFLKEYVVMQDDEYHIMTLWIMASWLIDDFSTCPYLLFIAPKSSGKSQAMQMLSELAYRAIISISTTPSALFRSIEMWKITLLIDEAENQVRMDTETGQALYGCLNGGYKKNSYALRIEGEARMPTSYDVFGFKAIASTRVFHPTLESRSIIINMTQGKPPKVLIDNQAAEHLRSKLLYFKFTHSGKMLLKQPKSNNGRLIEMFIPLFTVAEIFKGCEGIKSVIDYDGIQNILNKKITEMESVRKEEERESLEARIISALIDLVRNDMLSHDRKDYITVQEIAEIANMTDAKAPQMIGLKLRVMGIRTEHKKNGSVINYSDTVIASKLVELEKRFLSMPKRQGLDQRGKLRVIRDYISDAQKNTGYAEFEAIRRIGTDDDIRHLKSSGDIIEISEGKFRTV